MNDNSNEPIKDTKHLFKTLNINENTLTDAQKESIRENGYLVIHPTKSILANLKKLNEPEWFHAYRTLSRSSHHRYPSCGRGCCL